MSSLILATTPMKSMCAPTTVLLVGVLCAVSFAPASRAQTGKRTAAIISYGVTAVDVEPALRSAIATLATITLNDAKSTAADVAAAAELGTTCDAASNECLASLAVLLHVDVLVVSFDASDTSDASDASDASNGEGDGNVIEIVVVDAAVGKATGAAHVVVAADAKARTARLRDAAELLLEPHLHFGTLLVRAPSPSLMAIDGVHAADHQAPARVRAGRHRIVVEQDGYQPFNADVFVAAGADVVLDAVMHPLAPQASSGLASGGWIMAASGAGIVLAGGAVALGVDAGLAAGLGSADEKESYQAVGVIALVVASTGAVVGAVGLAVALFAGD